MNTRNIFSLACLLVVTLTAAANAEDRRDWGQKLFWDMRYEVLVAFNNEAILDRETQVVWQVAPSSSAMTWSQARRYCRLASTGGRMGWRLPNLHELSALYALNDEDGDGLFVTAPFQYDGVQQMYWTATSAADDAYTDETSSHYAYAVETRRSATPNSLRKKDMKWGAWCVRGHSATDTY